LPMCNPLYPGTRTLIGSPSTSASGQKRTCHSRVCPKVDIRN
jgi:hypothetical protein